MGGISDLVAWREAAALAASVEKAAEQITGGSYSGLATDLDAHPGGAVRIPGVPQDVMLRRFRQERQGWRGATRVTSSTIDIGKLVVDLFDPAKKQLVWRGAASKTLDIKKDPDKNYQNLQKAMAKLFKSYPPGSSKS